MPVFRMREAANCSVTGITHIFETNFGCSHQLTLYSIHTRSNIVTTKQIRAVAGQRSSPKYRFADKTSFFKGQKVQTHHQNIAWNFRPRSGNRQSINMIYLEVEEI